MAADENTTLRVGIIGARIGQRHALAYEKAPNVEVAAICDVNEERSRQAAEACAGNPAIFTDYRVMLERADLDAVSICLPNALHHPVALHCLDAGAHILCEKPLATNAADAQAIADAAQRANKKCMVAQVIRFRADSLWLKDRVLSGDVGRLYYARTGWLRQRGIPSLGGWFTQKAQSGGGPLIDIGVHMLDLAWWLCGCPKPLTASGSTFAEFGPRGKGFSNQTLSTQASPFDVEDLAVGLIRCEGDITISIEVSWALHTRRDRQWCHIFGEKGGLEWGENAALFQDEKNASVVTEAALEKNDYWKEEIAHFVDAIRHDTAPDPDAAQGVTMMKMLDGLYRSAQFKREVEIS